MGNEKTNKTENFTENFKIKAIIFDFDDTLVNTREESVKRHKEAAKIAGLQFDEKEFLKLYGKPWPDLLEEIYGSKTKKFLDTFNSLGDFFSEKIDGADEVIKKLASKNILLGVLSSGLKKEVHQRSQKELGCLELFDKNIVISKEDTKKHKPSKEAFSSTLSYLKTKNIDPENTLYCGDLLVDFEFARNANIFFIAAVTGPHTKEDFVAAGLNEERIIPSVKELPKKLEELKLI